MVSTAFPSFSSYAPYSCHFPHPPHAPHFFTLLGMIPFPAFPWKEVFSNRISVQLHLSILKKIIQWYIKRFLKVLSSMCFKLSSPDCQHWVSRTFTLMQPPLFFASIVCWHESSLQNEHECNTLIRHIKTPYSQVAYICNETRANCLNMLQWQQKRWQGYLVLPLGHHQQPSHLGLKGCRSFHWLGAKTKAVQFSGSRYFDLICLRWPVSSSV